MSFTSPSSTHTFRAYPPSPAASIRTSFPRIVITKDTPPSSPVKPMHITPSSSMRLELPNPIPAEELHIINGLEHARIYSPTLRTYVELGACIGRGGHAFVHVARRLVLGCPEPTIRYVVKYVVDAEQGFHEGRIQRYTCLNAESRHIVPCIDVIPGNVYGYLGTLLVLPYYNAGDAMTLTLHYHDFASINPQCRVQVRYEMLQLFLDILHGVIACHAVGVSHRDIKLENVLLTKVNEKTGAMRALISDFGVATLDRNSQQYRYGSAETMAPEVLHGSDAHEGYDPILADTWSLGITLYFLLTGSYPWRLADSEESDTFARYSQAEKVDSAVGACTLQLLATEGANSSTQLDYPYALIIAGLLRCDPKKRANLTLVQRTLEAILFTE